MFVSDYPGPFGSEKEFTDFSKNYVFGFEVRELLEFLN